MLFVCVAFIVVVGQVTVNGLVDDISDIKGTYESPGYDQLNALLVNKLKPSEVVDKVFVEANMAVAREELNRQKVSNSGRSFVKALRLFTAMSTLEGDDKCSPAALNILNQNDQALTYKARQPENEKTCHRRVEKIFIYYVKENAKACQNIYPGLMREKLAQVDKKTLEIVDQLSREVAKKNNIEGDDRLVVSLIFNVAKKDEFLDFNDSEFVLETLKNLVKTFEPSKEKYLSKVDNELTGLVEINKKEFQRIFEANLMNPCQSYADAVGFYVFNPAWFLAKWHHELIYEEPDYYKKWLAYTACMKVNQKRELLFQMAYNQANKLQKFVPEKRKKAKKVWSIKADTSGRLWFLVIL